MKTAQRHAQIQITNQQSAPQTSQKEENQKIPFILTFHPLNLPVKNIILKNFKLLHNDNKTSRIFSLPPLISFKCNKNISDFLVRSTLKSDKSPCTFNLTRKRCKTCPFIHNADKVTGPKRSIKITDGFICTSANVIYCIKCTLSKKIDIGETGRRLGDRFREHLRDVERNDKDVSKPVARHFNLPNNSTQNMATRKAVKTYNRTLSFNSVLLIPTVSTNVSRSFNYSFNLFTSIHTLPWFHH